MSISSRTKRRIGRNAPTVIIIDHHTLARTTIVKLLEHELAGWEFVDMVSTESLDRALGMDVRLIALGLEGRSVESAGLLDDLTAIAERFSEAPIALLSSTDDASLASQALKMGIRGFFTTSIPIEIALAGLRLVLAGGIFCPQPLDTLTTGPTRHIDSHEDGHRMIEARAHSPDLADFTPREADVLAELQRGCSNKVIAGKLNLSGHTVKMHVQHIMRKLQVQNRTEVVARLGYRLTNGHDVAAS
ncbi:MULTISPECIES: LuxR C-terminal-related transcriptional regulator [Rhizobium]|uniref:DNA-binding NarL/FixJ family response regulator n=1 Tax=Rhizobium paranaense TaxID=1650438 RepID=A0A7W8XY68_9HYPH|nr:response regulator transcription factor [Rhizobium sp. SEMIA4064]MBB5577726.1 DNA-binding NarL/FixJ family response regulator [Rhizobium paranaense]PST61690.1 DNA-binding response regulator [Rhizobium sp. SEMIA4064]